MIKVLTQMKLGFDTQHGVRVTLRDYLFENVTIFFEKILVL